MIQPSIEWKQELPRTPGRNLTAGPCEEELEMELGHSGRPPQARALPQLLYPLCSHSCEEAHQGTLHLSLLLPVPQMVLAVQLRFKASLKGEGPRLCLRSFLPESSCRDVILFPWSFGWLLSSEEDSPSPPLSLHISLFIMELMGYFELIMGLADKWEALHSEKGSVCQNLQLG